MMGPTNPTEVEKSRALKFFARLRLLTTTQRSRYLPHQGKQEVARRQRQIAKGMLKANG